jgi:hypothetical protein
MYNNYLNEIRRQRNNLLIESDKYMIVDYPITPENLEKIKTYRQELRDYFQKPEVNNLHFPNLPQLPL